MIWAALACGTPFGFALCLSLPGLTSLASGSLGVYNHHKAHTLPDWDDALLDTSYAGGHNVNYSHRSMMGCERSPFCRS